MMLFIQDINFRKGKTVMEGDIVEMGKYIGAGLACTGMGGAAVGVGHVVGNFLAGALRNPSAAPGQTATMFIGIAFAEALGIFSFLVALLLMYA
tara:strand:- start:2131 stop:2412 length:282 start_codon:yes stop_codon:yes gene_type:complete